MSKDNFKALLLTTLAAISDIGEKGLPSGHLYAAIKHVSLIADLREARTNMSKDNFKALLLMTLAAISDIGEKGLPSSHLYAIVVAFLTHPKVMSRCDLNTYNTIIGILADSKWITHKSHYITITPRGKEIGDKVSAAMQQG